MFKLAEVLPYQQKTQWTCSAACLKAVLLHWGKTVPEIMLIWLIGAKKGKGAETTQIVEAAKKLGFKAIEGCFSSLEEAKAVLELGCPIICDLQSFKNPGKGHYVVLTGIDEQGVHLMDPNVEGNVRVISPQEMEERWWSRRMAPPHELTPKFGIIVTP